MGKGKAPKPPDMTKLANAQTSANIGTALTERMMNMGGGMETPDGSVSYSQSGIYDWTDPVSGKKYSIPLMKSTTSLSAAQQAIKDKSDSAKLTAAGIADTLGRQFAQAGDFENDIDNRIYDMGLKRVQPRMDEARRRAETNAVNRGIRPGSAAFDVLMRDVGQQENDAYTQLALNSRGQAMNERAQRAGEITGFLGMGQPAAAPVAPQYQSNLPTVDHIGLGMQNYQNQLGAWQQKNQSLNQALGGMFGIAGNFIKYSDRRLKTDINKVGRTDDGQNIYSYRYRGDKRMHLGLMAQEVEKKHPDAVVDVGGYKAVDYSKALHLGA